MEDLERKRQRCRDGHWQFRARGLCHTCRQPREPGNDGWNCQRVECRARRKARDAKKPSRLLHSSAEVPSCLSPIPAAPSPSAD